uniref:Uncharacterized protein n=1 Tax=Rhizophora mucronata TaxID=61149 RepID=A0A2P2NBY4_RHIMU
MLLHQKWIKKDSCRCLI